MSSVNQKPLAKWLPYFFAALRRQPNARKYQYKNNIPEIRQLKLQDAGKRLTASKGKSPIPVFLNGDIFDININDIKKLIFEDARRSNESVRFGLDVLHENGGPVKDWKTLASIFQTPIDPKLLTKEDYYNMAKDNTFTMRHTIKLKTTGITDGSKPFDNVLWPKLVFSNHCRGIGVTPDLFEKISKMKVFVRNPTTNTNLPIIQVDFIPKGYDCIGLFPRFEEKHFQVFQKMDKFSALIDSKLCDDNEIRRMKSLVNTDIGEEVSSVEIINTKGAKVDRLSEKNTLSKLLNLANFDSKLWSIGSNKDRTCPGDILRSAIIAKSTGRNTIRKETMKHYILFNTISLLRRLREHQNKNGVPDYQNMQQWKPWDYAIWYIFHQHLAMTPKIKTFEDLQLVRAQYSRFLEVLSQYTIMVTSEMKLMGSQFFEVEGKESISRSDMVTLLLSSMLRETKYTELLYPGLNEYIMSHIPAAYSGTADLLPKLGNEKSYANGVTLLRIISELINFENIVHKDKFTSYRNMVSQFDSPITDWKVIIVYKNLLSEDFSKTIQFTTRIFTQFVTSLDDVDKVSYSKCIAKEMIDENTFVYLYKMSREPKSTTRNVLAEILKQKN